MPLTDSEDNANANYGEMYAYPLSSWAYLFKLRQMEQTVQLGFELDIYQQDELAGMYWFVYPLIPHGLFPIILCSSQLPAYLNYSTG